MSIKRHEEKPQTPPFKKREGKFYPTRQQLRAEGRRRGGLRTMMLVVNYREKNNEEDRQARRRKERSQEAGELV